MGEASNPGPAGTFDLISLNISSAKAHWQTLVNLAQSYDALSVQESRLGAQAQLVISDWAAALGLQALHGHPCLPLMQAATPAAKQPASYFAAASRSHVCRQI